jgi:hypothetical protein
MKTSKALSAQTRPARSGRKLLRSLALSLLLSMAGSAIAQQPPAPALSINSVQALPVVDVYKSPQCGCCESWAKHLQKAGFKVVLHDVNNVYAAQKTLGMPERFASCHTAKVGKYLVEGHVPAADIQRLLREHPQAIGLAVPSMVPGSPGMEGNRSVPFDTLLIAANGTATIYSHH